MCILILNEPPIKLGMPSFNRLVINFFNNDMQHKQQFGFIGYDKRIIVIKQTTGNL